MFLLFILAAGSILGTVIPQTTEVGPLTTFSQRLIAILDLNNVYRSWWFGTLLGLLTLNLLGCLLERLPSIPKEWKGQNQKSTFSFTVHDARNPSQVKKILVQALKKSLGSPEPDPAGNSLRWVKDKIHLLGFPFIHVAIIVILAGGLIGLFYGFRGHISIKEGETANQFALQSGQLVRLPFDISVEAFTLTHYPTGEPKEFRSDVRILENGKESLKGSILVNHPLTHKGISLFQSDYRVVGVKEVRFSLTDAAGKTSEFAVSPYTVAKLAGTEYELRLHSLDPGGTKLGAGAELSVERSGEEPRNIRLYKKDSAGAKIGDVELRYTDYVPLYATGLQVGYDPGAVVVWAGWA
jgi:cytochrome c biogenesis protein